MPYKDGASSRYRIKAVPGVKTTLRCNTVVNTGETVTPGQRIMLLGQDEKTRRIAVVTERGSFGWLLPNEVVSMDAGRGEVIATNSSWG